MLIQKINEVSAITPTTEFRIAPLGMVMSNAIADLVHDRDNSALQLAANLVSAKREDAVLDRYLEAEQSILSIPAETFGDVVAKLRTVFVKACRDHTDECEPYADDLHAFASAIGDLERLAAN